MGERDYFIMRDLPDPEFIEQLLGAAGEQVRGTQALAALRLLLVAGGLRSAMEAALSGDGTSISRMQLFLLLMRSEGQRAAPSRLAEQAGVSTATITGVVDTLERQGFVRREPHPSDRRRRDVVLTDAGRAFVRWIAPRQAQRVKALMSGLSDEDVPVLHGLLDRLEPGINALRDAVPQESFPEEGGR